jgi:hypothetical protein
MPGARRTRGLARKGIYSGARAHTGLAETLRHSLRNGFTAYAVQAVFTSRISPKAAE